MKRIFSLFIILAMHSVVIFAQNEEVTLRGTVIDENSEPVIGASVYVKDRPGVGSTTNIDGEFTLKVNRYDVVVVSYLGYKKYEHRITESSPAPLSIELAPEDNDVEEVVVVGLGTQRKISVAGAISTVDPKDLEVPATNIQNTLAGRVPGIIAVQRSGEPGKNISEFWVRGIGTFGYSSGALVLVDGVEGTLSSIDAADIESFSVLKDAAATAVYGNRGANGVVLINTKHGSENKLQIRGRANMTISHLKRLPDYVDGFEYASLANEAAAASGMEPIYDATDLDIIKYGLDPDLYPNINWQDAILNKNSFQRTYYISAQGGSSIARYFASLGMSNESSAYKSSDDSKYNRGVGYNTYNYRLNLDINLTKTTKVYVGATGFMSINTRPSMGSSALGVSLTDWLWSSQAKTTPLKYPLRYTGGYLPAVGSGDQISPYVLLNYTGNAKDRRSDNLVTLSLEQDLSMITKGLSAKLQGTYNNQGYFYESRYKMPALYIANGRTSTGELLLSQRVTESAMNYNSSSWWWRKLLLDATLNYDRVFGIHRLGGLLYYRMEDSVGSGASSSMDAIPRRYQSLSGRFTYGLNDTYFADLNFGYTGSENFKPGKQFGFFPAAALAWVPTSYQFVKDHIKWLSFLKFRVSYGLVGNDQISSKRYPYLTLISQTEEGVGRWGGRGSITESQVGADNLEWEKAKKFDAGIDLHLFDDKFTLTLDYFLDRRDNIFQQRTQIPSYVGAIDMPYGNVGSMKSWGGDGQFEYFHSFNKSLYLTLRGNFTISKNKIKNWEQADQPYAYLRQAGYGYNVQRGYIALGLFKDNQDVEMSPTQFGTVRPGDIKYKDVNGDGRITSDDMVPLFANSGTPIMMYGLGAELRWKNLTLNVLFKGTGTNKFLYGGSDGGRFDGYIAFNQGAVGNVIRTAADPNNRWISAEYSGDPSTENPNARFPRLYYGYNSNNDQPSTFWMGNAKYLRLQELSLNYQLKTEILRRYLAIQSIDIQLMMENLFVWDSVKIFDPEQATSCGQAYPIPGRYSLQLYFTF
ncbi:MAG: TonB-dependent receptor [Prevotella sp.]|nr:TonB-dependent receptor [Prevotella sp.]